MNQTSRKIKKLFAAGIDNRGEQCDNTCGGRAGTARLAVFDYIESNRDRARGRLLSFIAVFAASYVPQHRDHKGRSVEYKRERLVHRHTHHHLQVANRPVSVPHKRLSARHTRTLPSADKYYTIRRHPSRRLAVGCTARHILHILTRLIRAVAPVAAALDIEYGTNDSAPTSMSVPPVMLTSFVLV
jgi:hypothetical protein